MDLTIRHRVGSARLQLPFLPHTAAHFLFFLVNMFGADDSSNDSFLESSSNVSSSAPPSPTKSARRPPAPRRLDSLGISPKDLVGKGAPVLCMRFAFLVFTKLSVIKRVRRSGQHPIITLDCEDGTTYQVRLAIVYVTGKANHNIITLLSSRSTATIHCFPESPNHSRWTLLSILYSTPLAVSYWWNSRLKTVLPSR